MPDQVIEIPGIGRVAFPDSMDDRAIEAAAARLYSEAGSSPTSNSPGPSSTPSVRGAVVGAGMAAAPALVRGLHAAAGPLARNVAPAATALAVASDLRRGNFRQAAYDAATGTVASGAAAKIAPRVASAVQSVTAPASVRPTAILDATGRAMTAAAPAGFVSRLAGQLSRFAGPAGVAIDAAFGEGSAGHSSPMDTPAVVAARQANFQQQYDAMARAKAERMRTGQWSMEDYIEAALNQLRGKER